VKPKAVAAPVEKQSKSTKGGARPGAGRKAGVRNKRTAALIDAVENSGETPLEYLLSVMRGAENKLSERLSAALGAAPYVHAKLASIDIEHTGENGGPIEHSLRVVFGKH